MKVSKGSVAITAIIVVLVLIIIGGGVWYFIKNRPQQVTNGEFKDWKTYRNEEYGFEVMYPGLQKKAQLPILLMSNF